MQESKAALETLAHDPKSWTILADNEGIDVNFANEFVKMTALHWAAFNNDVDVVKLLIEHGA